MYRKKKYIFFLIFVVCTLNLYTNFYRKTDYSVERLTYARILHKKIISTHSKRYAESLYVKGKDFLIQAELAYDAKDYGLTINFSNQAISIFKLILSTASKKAIKSQYLKLIKSNGQIKIKYKDELLWSNINPNDKIGSNIIVKTLSASGCIIEFRKNLKIKMSPHSSFSIDNLYLDERTGNITIDITLIDGNMLIDYNKSNRIDFKISFNKEEMYFPKTSHFKINKTHKKYSVYLYKGKGTLKCKKNYFINSNVAIIRDLFYNTVKTYSIPPAPFHISPKQSEELIYPDIVFKWKIVPDAVKYILEIAIDKDFFNCIYTETIKNKNRILVSELGNGNYYWRLTAVTDRGIESYYSNPGSFILNVNYMKPMLEIITPKDNTITSQSIIEIKGRTEPSHKVDINGFQFLAGADGMFYHTYELDEGLNLINVISENQSGVKTKLSRIVLLDTKIPVMELNVDDIPELTNDPVVVLRGLTERNAKIRVNNKSIPINDGFFKYSYELKEGLNRIQVLAFDIAGNVKQIVKYVRLDTIPPSLRILRPVRDLAFATSKQIRVIGECDKKNQVTFNLKPVFIKHDNTFEVTPKLNEGLNLLYAEATDKAGNVTRKIIKIIYIPDFQKQIVTTENKILTHKKRYFINGRIHPGYKVIVNDYEFVAEDNGKYFGVISLSEGKNLLNISVRDNLEQLVKIN